MTGQGIGGARVEVQLAGYLGDFSANASTATASDGSYALFGLPTGDYQVRVTAPGYAREYYDNVTPSYEATLVHATMTGEASGVDFDLTEGGSISGHVYRSDGVTTIGGVHVSVWPSRYTHDHGFHVTTTSDGSYTVTGLALGSYKVQVEAPDYASEYHGEVYCWPEALDAVVIPPDDTPDIDIRLDQSGSISGYVFESDGSTPIAEAILVADLSPPRECLGFGTQSNADGSYTIIDLPPSDYTLRTWATGFGYEYYDAKSVYSAADVIPVTAGSDTPGINFALDAGGPVTGHVYDENGTPISGVFITARLLTGENIHDQFATRPDGSYTLWLKTGSYLIGLFQPSKAPGYVPEWYNDHYDASNADPVQVTAPSETSGIDFYLAKAGSISGHVYEEDGTTPIAGASVYAFPSTGDHSGAGANTGPDGSYTIEGLPSGNYRVQATVSDHVAQYYNNAPDEASATEVVVKAPNDTPGIDFALSLVSE